MAVDKERVKMLLGHISDHTRVARIAGCDVSYISQLMADPEFAEGVALARLEQEEQIGRASCRERVSLNV